MISVFRSVPDWFSLEDQGGGIAVGSLAGVGTQGLIVFMVDPVGQNQGLYRAAKTLDDAGQVTTGWMPWIAVPDWYPFENQGGDVALADLDTVVLHSSRSRADPRSAHRSRRPHRRGGIPTRDGRQRRLDRPRPDLAAYPLLRRRHLPDGRPPAVRVRRRKRTAGEAFHSTAIRSNA